MIAGDAKGKALLRDIPKCSSLSSRKPRPTAIRDPVNAVSAITARPALTGSRVPALAPLGRMTASGLIDDRIPQCPDLRHRHLDDIAGLEPPRRIEARPCPDRRAGDDDVAGFECGEDRDVGDEVGEGE